MKEKNEGIEQFLSAVKEGIVTSYIITYITPYNRASDCCINSFRDRIDLSVMLRKIFEDSQPQEN